MCRITVAVLWIKYTLGFILITLLLQKKCPLNQWRSVNSGWYFGPKSHGSSELIVEMCRMTLVVLWTNFTHRFSLITLLLQKQCSSNSMEMCRITLVVLCTQYTHGFILITLSISTKMFLKLSGDVEYDFDGALDHFYPWVYSNNSFISNKLLGTQWRYVD